MKFEVGDKNAMCWVTWVFWESDESLRGMFRLLREISEKII